MTSRFNEFLGETKQNFGKCKVCKKPVIYEQCGYCSPKCHFLDCKPRDILVPPIPKKNKIPKGMEPVLVLTRCEARVEFEKIKKKKSSK